MSNDKPRLPAEMLQQAAEWYWTIREADVSDEVIVEWQTWLSVAPNHRRAFERIEATLEVVDGVESPRWPTEEELVGDRYDGSEAVAEWRTGSLDSVSEAGASSRSESRWGARQRTWAIAATIAAVVVTGALLKFRSAEIPDALPDYVLYQTEPAEHRDVMLPDGSSVALGGKSLISVAYRHDERIVVLRKGEAYFDVAKDPTRPFTVEAQGRDITAVGTAFNVSRQNARVIVTVAEGTVIVAPEAGRSSGQAESFDNGEHRSGESARLEAGHKLVYDDQVVMPISVTDPTDAAIWRKGLLKFRGEQLRYVVEDVGRYVDYPIVIANPTVGEMLFTGTVFQNSADSWVYGLEDAFPVAVTQTTEGVSISMQTDEARH